MLLVHIGFLLFGFVLMLTNAQVDSYHVQEYDVNLNQSRQPIRIINGTIAKLQQFPYQAGLLLQLRGGTAWCGATILNQRWLLTAAHCTDSLSTGIYVYLGAWNRTDAEELGQKCIFVPKSNVIVHERWNASNMQNDISLILLPVAIEFNACIQPANLPHNAESYSSYVDQMGIATGWGRISDESASISAILRWIQVPIMSNTICSSWFMRALTTAQLCIDTSTAGSTCVGDSGGPLVLADGSRTLIGLTSHGIAKGCAKDGPVVFTRVTAYLNWIAENIGAIEE